MTALLIEIVLSVIVVGGGLFGLIGSWGMLRLPETMQRLHAPTKATTLGVGAAIIASDIQSWTFPTRFAWEEILIALFLFVTAPLSALMLAKVHLARNLPAGSVPPPLSGVWATEAADRPQQGAPEDPLQRPD